MPNAVSKKVRLNPANYYLGAHGPQVTWLGKRLVAHGFGKHYTDGPGPTFTKADQANVRDFQHAQGWKGADADGLPGKETLKRLNAKPKPVKHGWTGTLWTLRAAEAFDGTGTRRTEHDLKASVSKHGIVVSKLAKKSGRWFMVGNKPHAFYYPLDGGDWSHAKDGTPIGQVQVGNARPIPVIKQPKVKKDPIAKIVSIAKGQVGYHEGRSNGHWNNIQKYAQQVPGLGWNNGGPWCATFVSWCAMKADLGDYYPRTATVSVAMAWFKQSHQWSEYPAVGAQVIYGVNGDSHTGLVYDYDSTYIYTVEGNTNTNGSAVTPTSTATATRRFPATS
jgi:hypothetical protein